MRIITWNCRGVGNAKFLRNCKDMMRNEHPDVLCLLETKADGGAGKQLGRKLKFDGVFEVNANGYTGGLILL